MRVHEKKLSTKTEISPENKYSKPLKKVDKRLNIHSTKYKTFRKKKNLFVDDDYIFEESDEEDVPLKIVSGMYQYYPKDVADETINFISNKQLEKKQGSCTNILRELLLKGDVHSIDIMDIHYVEEALRLQEESYRDIISENGMSKEEGCATSPRCSRIPCLHIPKLKSNRHTDSTKREVDSFPNIKKYCFKEDNPRLYSDTSLGYAEKKRVHGGITAKTASMFKQCSEKQKEIHKESTLGNMAPEIKECEEEIKKYMDKIQRVRMETNKHFRHLKNKYKESMNDQLQNTFSVALPVQNNKILIEREETLFGRGRKSTNFSYRSKVKGK